MVVALQQWLAGDVKPSMPHEDASGRPFAFEIHKAEFKHVQTCSKM